MNGHQKSDQARPEREDADSLPAWVKLIREQVVSLKFGTVQITVHEGKVVQMKRVEKFRLDRPS